MILILFIYSFILIPPFGGLKFAAVRCILELRETLVGFCIKAKAFLSNKFYSVIRFLN